MIYADYTYYTEAYLGTAISEEEFPACALRASAFLDYYTQGRAEDNAGLPALKMACCAVAEQQQMILSAQKLAKQSLLAGAESGAGEVQSESVGSFSRTYRSGGDSAGAASAVAGNAQAALAQAARQYLAGTGLLYRGRCRR